MIPIFPAANSKVSIFLGIFRRCYGVVCSFTKSPLYIGRIDKALDTIRVGAVIFLEALSPRPSLPISLPPRNVY